MSIFSQTTLVLVAAVVVVLLFKRLGLGVVLGYLAAGVLVGPSGLNVVGHVDEVLHISELGVVFFLFLVGLELAPRRLWELRRGVLGLGSGQVVGTGGAVAIIGLALGLSLPAALIAGLGLSLSSTAIALRLLADRGLSHAPAGQAGFAVLLFQDLAVVPMLALIPLLSGHGGETTAAGIALSTVKVVGMVALFLVGGRFLVRPVFSTLAKAGVHEISVMVALLLVVGAGLLMTTVGMSMALGAFLAGVLLADSEYRHELEANIDPFKGILLGLFFMAIGMSANLSLVRDQPGVVCGAVVAVVVVKTGVLTLLLRLAPGTVLAERVRVAAALSQGGEFAFVLFGVAAGAGLFTPAQKDLLIVVVSLSMATTPLVLPLIEWAVKKLTPVEAQRDYDADIEEAPIIIAGFGRVGQIVARVMGAAGHKFTALEIDPVQVDFVRKFGNKIFFGDAGRLDLLRAAGIERARAVVVAIDNVEANVRAVEVIKGSFPNVPIFARARNRAHVFKLKDLGVAQVERETLASSLALARGLLVELGYSAEDAEDIVVRFRAMDEEILEQQYLVHHDEAQLIQTAQAAVEQLRQTFEAESKTRKERLAGQATPIEALDPPATTPKDPAG
ncbi:MAG: monovalent cation:proton antiporter-2 (CPA2) family protein [Deltaproteobacteria bacterium]|nr:monovalent cation:proton antiporter-2 (CPA2) family protein [Deltaproteobacteria bacterium]